MIPKKSRLTKIGLFYQEKLLYNIDQLKIMKNSTTIDESKTQELQGCVRKIVDDEEKFSQFLNRMAFYYSTDHYLDKGEYCNTKNHPFFSSKAAMGKMTDIMHRKFTSMLECTLKDLEKKNYKEGLIEELKDRFKFPTSLL